MDLRAILLNFIRDKQPFHNFWKPKLKKLTGRPWRNKNPNETKLDNLTIGIPIAF